MREMKDSGIEWVGNIPATWKSIQIKKLFTILSGATPTPNTDNWDGDVLWITPADYKTKDKYVSGGKRNISQQGFNTCSTSMIPKGSIIFSKRAPIGTVAINTEVLCTNQGCLSCVSKADTCNDYYYYVMSVGTEHFELLGSGTTFKEISANSFSNCKLPCPDKCEQEKIASFLDERCSAFNCLISDIQSQIEALEEYKKSLVFRIISRGIKKASLKSTVSDVWTAIPETWELIDIKYVFEIVKRIAGQEGFDVLSVTQKGLKVKDIESNNGQQAESYAGYQFVYPTDYVMNHMDLLTGWVDCSTMFGVTSPDYRVFRLRDKENNDLIYFKYVMQCCYMSRIFYSLGQGVSNLGRWRLQTSAFNNFMIPVPPLEEQREIAEYLDTKISEIDTIIAEKQKQIETIEEYKKSLIFEYVTGKKEVAL